MVTKPLKDMRLPFNGTDFQIVLTEENEHSRRLTLENSKDRPFNCMACGEMVPSSEPFEMDDFIKRLYAIKKERETNRAQFDELFFGRPILV